MYNGKQQRDGKVSTTAQTPSYDREWDSFDYEHLPDLHDYDYDVEFYDHPSYYNDKYIVNKGKNRVAQVPDRRSGINDWLPTMTISLMLFYMGVLMIAS